MPGDHRARKAHSTICTTTREGHPGQSGDVGAYVTEIGGMRGREAPKFGDKESSTWRFRICRPFGLILFCFFFFFGFPPLFSLLSWDRPGGRGRGLIQAGRAGNQGQVGWAGLGTRRGKILFCFFPFSEFPFFFFSNLFPQKNMAGEAGGKIIDDFPPAGRPAEKSKIS